MYKYGLSFYSFEQHRIIIENAKIMQVGNLVYVKRNNKMFILKNVDNIQVANGFLYFKAEGHVEIILNCRNIYKYFSVDINSQKLNISAFKDQALNFLATNPMSLNNNSKINHYINFLKNILNIDLDGGRLKIGRNKFKIPFSLTYKLNGKIKKVNILETF